MAKYPVVKPNEWIRPKKLGYRMMCCDCSLVHEIDFKVIRYRGGNIVLIRARRNNRATAAARRQMEKIVRGASAKQKAKKAKEGHKQINKKQAKRQKAVNS